MTFDPASFALGITACILTAIVGYHIIVTVEKRREEIDLWTRVQSAPSPSARYWQEKAKGLEQSELEESVTIRPPSQQRRIL